MRVGVLVTGVILVVLGVIAYVYPITSTGSASDVNDICNSAIGSLGKVLNQQVRENCQTVKYVVLGSYALIGIGGILIIVGSILKSDSQPNQPLSPQTKKSITIGIGIIFAVIIGVIVYQLSLQPDIEASNLNVNPTKNPQFVTLSDQGRVSKSGNFNYVPTQSGTYYIIFSNDFSIISTKSVFTTYTDRGQQYQQSFTVPPGSYKSIPVWANSGQSITGAFSVSGGSGDDVDFSISSITCTQTISFTFNLSNTGQVNGNADVSFDSDGRSVWSNNYSVESGKQTSGSGSVSLSDCNSHDYKVVVTNQKRVG